MEEPLLSDKEDCASELLGRIDGYVAAEKNRGMVWRRFASRRTGDVWYSMTRLKALPGRSQDVSQPAREGFDCHSISGIGFRYLSEAEGIRWHLETMWEGADINDIRLANDYEWRDRVSNYNGQMGARIGMEENVYVVWVRMIRDWSRLDGNVLTMQIFWNGNFSYRQLLVKLFDDQNNPNSVRIIKQHFYLHPQLREQCIARYGTHPFAAAYSAVDSSPSVVISCEIIASRGGGVDRDGAAGNDAVPLMCVVCQEQFSVGCKAKQLPCSHLFHKGCIFQWFRIQLRCPVCRARFRENSTQSSVSRE